MAGPVWLPAVAGGLLGGLYAGLNRAGMRRFWRAPQDPLCVVVTGGTKGIGKALAREFLQCDPCRDAANARVLAGHACAGYALHSLHVCSVISVFRSAANIAITHA